MKCKHCNGTGIEIDHVAIGKEMRLKRKISLREMARRLNYSAAYISDLELGRRNWSEDLIMRYKAAL